MCDCVCVRKRVCEKLESNTFGQVLMMKATVLGKQVKELPSTFQPDVYVCV